MQFFEQLEVTNRTIKIKLIICVQKQILNEINNRFIYSTIHLRHIKHIIYSIMYIVFFHGVNTNLGIRNTSKGDWYSSLIGRHSTMTKVKIVAKYIYIFANVQSLA